MALLPSQEFRPQLPDIRPSAARRIRDRATSRRPFAPRHSGPTCAVTQSLRRNSDRYCAPNCQPSPELFGVSEHPMRRTATHPGTSPAHVFLYEHAGSLWSWIRVQTCQVVRRRVCIPLAGRRTRAASPETMHACEVTRFWHPPPPQLASHPAPLDAPVARRKARLPRPLHPPLPRPPHTTGHADPRVTFVAPSCPHPDRALCCGPAAGSADRRTPGDAPKHRVPKHRVRFSASHPDRPSTAPREHEPDARKGSGRRSPRSRVRVNNRRGRVPAGRNVRSRASNNTERPRVRRPNGLGEFPWRLAQSTDLVPSCALRR